MLKVLDPVKNLQETQRKEGLIELYQDYEINKIKTLGNYTGHMAQGQQEIKPKKEMYRLQYIKRDLHNVTNLF